MDGRGRPRIMKSRRMSTAATLTQYVWAFLQVPEIAGFQSLGIGEQSKTPPIVPQHTAGRRVARRM